MSQETTMNELIGRIIEDRQQKVGKLKAKRDELAGIKQNLERLWEKQETVKDANMRQMMDDNPWLKELLEDPKLIRESMEAYTASIEELDRLINRFSRNSVNISVVGDSKAGKSQFLQTVSGLDNSCIPSFPGSFCTGVSSIIENDSEISDVKGVFIFKSEEEILAEINDKLLRITGGAIRYTSLDQVGNQSPNTLRQKMSQNAREGEKGYISDFVDMYVENYEKWSFLIRRDGSEEERYVCTKPLEIQQYVAKHNGGTAQEGGTDAIPFYRYIAVKKAEIYCRFKLTDVNKIRLVDTVGLGDLAVGTMDKMYEAIDRDSDAVLYFFRPKANQGGMIDERTYDILNRQLYPRYKNADMKRWMGVVVNYDGTNWPECVKFLEEFEDKATDMAQNIALKKIINVRNEEEVRVYSIRPLLESLSIHLGSIDERIEAEARSRIETANQYFARLKEKCSEICVPAPADIISNRFLETFKTFIEHVRKLSKDYEEKYSSSQDGFLEDSLKRINSLKDTEGEETTLSICGAVDCATEPGSKHSRAFGELHRIVRNIGSRAYEELDEIERAFKKDLAVSFLNDFKFEREKCPSAEDDDFFVEMAKRLFGTKKELIMMRDAFLSVQTFRLSETKGVTKLLFDENAQRYLNSMTGTERKNGVDYQETGKRMSGTVNLAAFGMPQKTDSDSSGLKDAKEEDPLIDEMNRQLDQFVKAIRESPFYKLYNLIPVSAQIASELQYFLRCFDFCYHREWSDVLNRQLRDGTIFAAEKREIDNLSDKFQQFRRLADKACVSVEIPQNI